MRCEARPAAERADTVAAQRIDGDQQDVTAGTGAVRNGQARGAAPREPAGGGDDRERESKDRSTSALLL